MIRNVTDRLTSRTRPAYKGRHRRPRSSAVPVDLTRAPEREEAAEPCREGELAVASCA